MRASGLGILVMFCAVLLLGAPAARADDEVLRLVFMEDYPPLSSAEDGRVQGILVEQLQWLFVEQMGRKVTMAGYPWKRAQRMVEVDEADVFCTIPTQVRQTYAQFSKHPVIHLQPVIVTGAANPVLAELRATKLRSDLKRFRMISYQGNGWAVQNLSDFEVQWVFGVENVLRSLDRNLADVFIENEWVARYSIRRYGAPDRFALIPAGSMVPGGLFHIGIRKTHPRLGALLDELDRVLERPDVQRRMREIAERHAEQGVAAR